jgi:hypothetical protein
MVGVDLGLPVLRRAMEKKGGLLNREEAIEAMQQAGGSSNSFQSIVISSVMDPKLILSEPTTAFLPRFLDPDATIFCVDNFYRNQCCRLF